MRLFKKLLRIIAIILPCLLAIFISKDSFAVSDHVETISPGTSISQNTPLFSNCDLTCIKQYKYLTVSIDNFNGLNYAYNIIAFYYFDSSNNGNMILSFRSFNAPVTYSIEHIDGTPKWSNEPYFPTGATLTLSEDFGGGGSSPSGSITFTENGTYDVTSYAEAVVDVPAIVGEGDYHDDLVSIRNVIIVCGGVILVLYFFYCIYGMIIPTTGGKK